MKTTTLRRIGVRAGLLTLAVGAVAGLAATSAQAVPATGGSQGSVTLSNVKLNGTSINYGFVRQGGNVIVSGSYVVDDSSGVINQIEIGWRGSASPVGCVYDGGPQASGTFRYNLGPAPAVGLNQVIFNYAQDFGCKVSTSNWWATNDGPVVGDVVVKPANAGSSGPIAVSGVSIVGSKTGNTQLQNGTRAVTLTGSFTTGDTDGAITQLQIGWKGAPLASACVPAQPDGTFKVNLGLPPNLGTNEIVVGYSQYFSCKRAWFQGSEPPTTALVGAVYNNES